MRILHWDIEATDLNANWGTLLCVGYKWSDENYARVISITDTDKFKLGNSKWVEGEKEVLERFSEIFDEADAHCTWYGARYDLPFLNTKSVFYGLPVLCQDTPHIDLWRTSRYQLKLNNNRLQTCGDYFFHNTLKTRIQPAIWRKASVGDKKSLSYVVQHCGADVYELERMYFKLRPLIKNHPNVMAGRMKRGEVVCKYCRSTHVQYRGYHYTKENVFRKYQCLAAGCRKWDFDRKALPKDFFLQKTAK